MMTDERKLADIAMMDELWSDVATEMFRESLEVSDQAERYGRDFLQAHHEGKISTNALKRMTKEANWLEREAIAQSEGDIDNFKDADYIEAMARRVAHHTLKYALERHWLIPRWW